MVKINIIDIGARYGIHPTWQEFKNEGNFYNLELPNLSLAYD